MYDLTKPIETEQNGLSYILPGIHDNIRLAKPDDSYPIVYEKSKNGSEFIALHFMNEEGQTFVHTEWVPSVRDITKDQEVLDKKQSNLVKRLLHIGKKFVDESVLKFKADTFEELAKLYIRAIGDNYKGKLFRVKIVYNNKNYTTFPNYIPFIESMSVEKEKSNLRMSADDKVAKSRADVISTQQNPFNEVPEPSNESTANDLDQLPF